jgi:CcmD family protein
VADFLSQNALYIVLFIVLICWLGIFFYLFRLEKKISALEKRMKG